MEVKYLEKWINSPITGRRRKAIYRLSKATVHGKYDIKSFMEHAKRLIDDTAWSVQASAVSGLARVSERYQDLSNEIVDIIVSKIKEERHPNFIGAALVALGKVSKNLEPSSYSKLLALAEKFIKHSNNDIRHGSIFLLTKIATKNSATKIAELLYSILEDSPDLLRREILMALRNLYIAYPEETKKYFIDVLEKLREGAYAYYVKAEYYANLALAIKNGLITLDETLLQRLIKDFRAGKPKVKSSILDCISEIVTLNPDMWGLFLPEIIKYVLKANTNKHLKIQALELILKHVDSIPREIINSSDLPRILDIIEYNTTPKNEDYRKIKTLARIILEDKLGYTYEERRRLREEKA